MPEATCESGGSESGRGSIDRSCLPLLAAITLTNYKQVISLNQLSHTREQMSMCEFCRKVCKVHVVLYSSIVVYGILTKWDILLMIFV